MFTKLFLADVADNPSAVQSNPMILAFAALVSLLLVLALSGVPLSMSAFLAWRFASVSKDLGKQLQQVKELSEKTQEQEAEKQRILENQKAQLEEEVTLRTAEIVEEKKKSDQLLLNILPEEVARELKEKGRTTAHQYDSVSVMFTDFVDFTVAGSQMQSQALVEELDSCFKAFDEIMGKHGIEKIKTIGDAYLAVCGLPTPDPQHAKKTVAAAKEIVAYMQQRRAQLGDKTFEIRIGIHSGEVVAGIVGVKKFAYDIWGDTVNTAARMESNSEPGKINISQTTYELVKDKYTCTYRGEIEAKNKGMMKMYFVEG
jgi:class 3 adenylate cyclase